MKKMKFLINYILLVSLISCEYSDGYLGATLGSSVGNPDAYDAAQREIMKHRDINFGNFPDIDIRHQHITNIKNGEKVDSWFQIVNEYNDTLRTNFSCEVYLSDDVEIGYYVEKLIIEEKWFPKY